MSGFCLSSRSGSEPHPGHQLARGLGPPRESSAQDWEIRLVYRGLKDFKRKTTFLILYPHFSLRGKQQGLGFCKQEGIKCIKTTEVPLEGLVMTASNVFSTFSKGQLELLLRVSLALFSRNASERGCWEWSRKNIHETSEATLSFGRIAPCKL